MSALIDIADAVVASLNAGPFPPPFEAVRLYQPVYELEDVKTLRVSVVPSEQVIEAADRGGDFFDCSIDVAVQKRLDPDTPDRPQLDALMDLVERIADHLRNVDLGEASFVRIASEPVFAPEHLDQWRQFTGLLTATYRVRR